MVCHHPELGPTEGSVLPAPMASLPARALIRDLWRGLPALGMLGLYGYALMTNFWAPTELLVAVGAVTFPVWSWRSLAPDLLMLGFNLSVWGWAFGALLWMFELSTASVHPRRDLSPSQAPDER